MKVKLTRPAIKDLAEIGRYSRETWGEDQAKRYRAALSGRFKWLCRNKPLWRLRPDLPEAVFTYTEQSHVIVFWEYEQSIEILRVLHSRMDLKRHLGEISKD